MLLNQKEIDVLRELGEKYMKYASLPVQREKLSMWKAINRGKMERPMVLIDQLPWNELLPVEKLQITSDPFWRSFEYNLRQTIYKWENFPVDMVLEPFITIPSAVMNTGFGVNEETEVIHLSEDDTAPARHYKAIIKDPEDVSKIQDMHIKRDDSENKKRMDTASHIFGETAPFKLSNGIQFHLGLWDRITTWMGVENIYIDLIDRPEFLHALMDRLTISTLNGIDEANAIEANDDNINICHCSHIYTDDLLPDFGSGKGPLAKNCWSLGLAQLFSSVSPEVTEEFEIPYISRLAERMGYIYYGCCDRLDDRLDLVKRIPNVKKVSCSPWSNVENFAKNIGPDLVMSAKPNPAFIAVDTNESVIRDDLKRTIEAAKGSGVNLELILKDISTVEHKPERIIKWAETAMNLVEKN